MRLHRVFGHKYYVSTSRDIVGHQYYVSTNMCAKLLMPIRPSLGAADEQITKANGDIAGERGVLPMNNNRCSNFS